MGTRGAVLNGRDIGTVVFPDADVKFFLTAQCRMNARNDVFRRTRTGSEAPILKTFADMTERDRRDSTRADSPFKSADDAIMVDSTGLSIDEVFEKMMAAIEEKSG